MANKAVPIHAHLETSNLDGYSTVEERIEHLQNINACACCLTDHGVVAGHKPFYDGMLEAGLKPLLGVEAYLSAGSRRDRPKQDVIEIDGKKKRVQNRDASHLILVAQSSQGLRNINIMSDIAAREGTHYGHPRMDFDLLEQYNEGVICTTACMASLVCQGLAPIWDGRDGDPSYDALDKLLNIFGERLFVELHTYSDPKQAILNQALVEAAKERGIPLLWASDAHYSCKDQYVMHEILLSMQMKVSVDDDKGNYSAWSDPKRWHPPDLYVLAEHEVREALDYLPESIVDEAIDNSARIADMCDVTFPESRLHLPVFIPEKPVESNKLLLIDLVWKGLAKRYGTPIPKEVEERAQFEVEAFCNAFGENERGLEDYLLITWDWIAWARSQGIRIGPGRGSSAGSIVTYALGITNIDPLKHDLYFERFWNPGRVDGLPDIDTDVQRSQRERVKAYLAGRYGANRVISIGNHNRFQPKLAIDKAGMALWGSSHGRYDDLEQIKAEINKLVDAGKQPDWETIWADEEVSEALAPWRAKHPDLFEVAEDVTGRLYGYGKHASAVIISDVDLPEILPCRYGKDDGFVTQIEMHEVESRGFVKFDVLGLRNLDIIQEVANSIGQPDLDLDNIDYESLPEDFWHNLEIGRTLGFFQIEDGRAARSIAKRLKARSIDDLAAIVALNRPGPLRGGVVDRFIDRREGKEPTEYAHPILTDILDKTYGDFLYQEAVIAYMRKIGYSLSDADHIRSILGKKKVELMKEELPRYLERASEFMSIEHAQAIWDGIEEFSKYSFNKAHSYSYAYILLQTMYCKWRWPAEFYAAMIKVISLSTVQDKMEKIGAFIMEARRSGIEVYPPDINKSDIHTAVVDGAIYFGLADVKYVSEDAAAYIIPRRPFADRQSMQDFLEHDSKQYSKMDEDQRKKFGFPKSPKQMCNKRAIESLESAGGFDAIGGREDLSSYEKAMLEEEIIGTSITDPDKDYLEYHQLSQIDTPMLSRLEEESATLSVTAFVDSYRTTVVRNGRTKGQQMAHVTLRWRGEKVRAVAFPETWGTYNYVFHSKGIGRFTVEPNHRGPVIKKAELVDAEKEGQGSPR